jgi:hypothetical protein
MSETATPTRSLSAPVSLLRESVRRTLQDELAPLLLVLLVWLLWGGFAVGVILCVVPLTFLLLLASAITSLREDGLGKCLLWLLLALVSLPLQFALPVLIALTVPLPIHRVVFVLLAVRLLDILVLLLAGRVPLQYNVRNLMVRWPITLLTAVAFTLVIGLMTVMLAFVNGMYCLTAGSARPGNVMVLSDGATDELFSNLGYEDSSDVANQPGILHDDKDRPLSSSEVYFVVNQPIPGAVKGGRQRRFVQVRGIEDPVMAGKVHGLPLHEGGAWFSPAGVDTLKDEQGNDTYDPVIQAVLGEGIAREMGHDIQKPTLQPGDFFAIGPRKWMVTGVLKSAGSTFDSEIWAKRQLVGPMFGKSNYSTIVLRTADAETAQKVAENLTRDFKKAALQAQTEAQYYDKLNATNLQFLVISIVVTVVLAVGGIFGVMNAMFAAISARTKDIGVLRLLGFARRQILVSFLLESLVLALIGGVIGCAVGSLFHGVSATSTVGGGGGGGKSVVLQLVVDWNIVAIGLLLTLLMGGLGGLLPALSAMRLKPLESLR